MALHPHLSARTELLPEVRSPPHSPRLLLIHPHRPGPVVLVNASADTTSVYAAIRKWFAADWGSMFVVLGADYSDALLDLVDTENLPASLGGTCTCGTDGGCEAVAGAGPWMDGRKERRAQWLAGECAQPGMCWPHEKAGEGRG
jgi:hypothetical protein